MLYFSLLLIYYFFIFIHFFTVTPPKMLINGKAFDGPVERLQQLRPVRQLSGAHRAWLPRFVPETGTGYSGCYCSLPAATSDSF
jgi:hypothetical protein